MTRRTQSSSRRLQAHFSDPYVRRVGATGKVIASHILQMEMAGRVLKPGGRALIKVFQGAGFQELTVAARRQFKTVRFLKAAASRARSAEMYLLAGGLRLV